VDTRLGQDTVALIADRLKDGRVGGVCGTLKVEKPHHAKPGLGRIQQLYWDYEWWIKNTEMKTLGSVTSCTGLLMAIRKDLYPGLPKDVNDDLYLALSVVAGGHRFLAAPEALAFVPPPSKTLQDELKRRPRIVAGSLTAIWRHRRLLGQLNTFWYGVCLYLHKVVRRLTPVLLAVILAASGLLALTGRIWLYFFIVQILGYALAWFSFRGYLKGRLFGIMGYLLAFNIGTGRGLYEFLTQKGRSKW
jgi:cellulose synthase/poly-beta-1,6-N-acetylglucosamine synthase-like glycosyltransferase